MRGIKSFVSAGALFAASCLLVTAAFAQGNNAPAPGKAPGNSAGGFQAPQKDDQTCIANRDACGKVPGNIAGGFRERASVAARRAGAPNVGRTCGPDWALVSKRRWKNAAGCLSARPQRV